MFSLEIKLNFLSPYEIGDPITIGLICENGMNESCKDSMPKDKFPNRIESDHEGKLMFDTEDEPSCFDLCKTKRDRRATKLKRRGWTKFVK